MKLKFNIVTRCTRVQNLKTVRESIFNTPEGVSVEWHIVFDTKVLKDIDAEILSELQDENTHLHFRTGDGWGLSQLNDLLSSFKTGLVYHVDDDNIVHPDFYKTILNNYDPNKKAYVFTQRIDGKDFTRLPFRYADPANIKVQKIDLAQWLLDSSVHSQFGYKYGSGYTADGKFIETLYKEHPEWFSVIKDELCYYNFLEKEAKARVPKILYIGKSQPKLVSYVWLGYESTDLNVKYLEDDSNILEELANFKPDCIVTRGEDWQEFTGMASMPLQFRRKWIHHKESDKDEVVGDAAYETAMKSMLQSDGLEDSELISYFTPIYNTGDKLRSTYRSLTEQTYSNWEWVLVNDSTDGGKTLKIAEELAKKDPRVRVYDFREKSGGNIGEAKYRACTMARGYILAELDHDDLLVPWCTEDLYKASKKHPECGFFFNDTLEVDENWNSLSYPPGFAFEYGSYREEEYRGQKVKVATQHNLNPKTIRHIVGVPNHVRAWRRSTYFEIGGHNRGLTIADDYELIVRTFLKTIMCKIPKLGYVQFIYNNTTGRNTHDLSRADIQRRVLTIARIYNTKIKERFEELGLKDWAYEYNPQNPLLAPSRFGEEEQAANITYIENDQRNHTNIMEVELHI